MRNGTAKETITGWAVIIGVLLLGFLALYIDGKIDSNEHMAYERGYEDALAVAEERESEEWAKGYERGRSQFFEDLMDSDDLLQTASDFFEAGIECAGAMDSEDDVVEQFCDYYSRYEFNLLGQTREPGN